MEWLIYLHRPLVCLELIWSYMEWLIPPPSPVCLELTWSYMEWLIPPLSPSLPRAYMELHGVAHTSTVPSLPRAYMELHGVTRTSTVPQFAYSLHGAKWSGSYLHRPPVCLELTWSYMEWLIPPPSPSLPRAYMELHGVAHTSTVP